MKQRKSASAARLNNLLRPLAVVSFCVIAGCAYGTLPPRAIAGNDFSVEVAKSIKEGDSAEEVRATLGDPLTIEERLDAEVWRYYFRERKDGVTYILGFVPKRTIHFVWDYELRLVVLNGEIQEAHYVETKIR